MSLASLKRRFNRLAPSMRVMGRAPSFCALPSAIGKSGASGVLVSPEIFKYPSSISFSLWLTGNVLFFTSFFFEPNSLTSALSDVFGLALLLSKRAALPKFPVRPRDRQNRKFSVLQSFGKRLGSRFYQESARAKNKNGKPT